jgi:hypothetical protein
MVKRRAQFAGDKGSMVSLALGASLLANDNSLLTPAELSVRSADAGVWPARCNGQWTRPGSRCERFRREGTVEEFTEGLLEVLSVAKWIEFAISSGARDVGPARSDGLLECGDGLEGQRFSIPCGSVLRQCREAIGKPAGPLEELCPIVRPEPDLFPHGLDRLLREGTESEPGAWRKLQAKSGKHILFKARVAGDGEQRVEETPPSENEKEIEALTPAETADDQE